MASNWKLILPTSRASSLLRVLSSSYYISRSPPSSLHHLEDFRAHDLGHRVDRFYDLGLSRSFCCRTPNLDGEGPATIDYHSLLQEDEFHMLADSTIQDLLMKLEEYSDSVQIDGLDIDYGNNVLTFKLGSLGTYVLNKQTPNRQIWLSSPVSGPSRFDWDRSEQAWVYRRTKANLFKLLETELEKLGGAPVDLS